MGSLICMDCSVGTNMLIFHLFKKVPRGGCNCIRTLLLWLVLSFMVQRLSEHKELFLLKLQDTNSILWVFLFLYDLDWKLNSPLSDQGHYSGFSLNSGIWKRIMNRFTEQLSLDGSSAGLRFNLLLRAGLTSKLDRLLQDLLAFEFWISPRTEISRSLWALILVLDHLEFIVLL